MGSPPPARAARGGEGLGVGGISMMKRPFTPAHAFGVRRPSPPLRGGRDKKACAT
jgi:hypothetical protein